MRARLATQADSCSGLMDSRSLASTCGEEDQQQGKAGTLLYWTVTAQRYAESIDDLWFAEVYSIA